MQLWGFWFGLIALAAPLFSGWATELLTRLPSPGRRAFALFGLTLSAYSVANGLHALGSWRFIDLLDEAVGQGVKTGPQGWLAILAIEFWPFVAIGIGGLGAWLYSMLLRSQAHRPRDALPIKRLSTAQNEENRQKATDRLRVVSAYGEFLEDDTIAPDMIADVSVLPFPKDAILDAICLELVREQDSKSSADSFPLKPPAPAMSTCRKSATPRTPPADPSRRSARRC